MSNPAPDGGMIRVYDAYGREFQITRQEWRTRMLPDAIRQRWDDADALAGLLVQSLGDGLHADLADAAERLYELDGGGERGAVLLAIVHLENGRLDDSERVLERHIETHGPTGVVLTNLAKVHAERGDQAAALDTLWRALELDPNQDNGLGWFEAIHREHGGDTAGLAAMRRVAGLPGSWRAQLWLAYGELGAHNLAGALGYYRLALERAGRPVPADLLLRMSGDLGRSGQLEALVSMTAPHFDAAAHGMGVGGNLIRAYAALGRPEPARQVLDALYAQQRPDWKEALAYWDAELARLRVGDGAVPESAPMRMNILSAQGPVWLAEDSAAAALYPRPADDAVLVTFLGASADAGAGPARPERQLADAAGRLSRAVPLYLNEQARLLAGARTQTLVPWLTQPSPGFVLSARAWDDNDALRYAAQCEAQSDFVVLTHLLAPPSGPWTAQLRLLRMEDESCVGELSARFAPADPAAALSGLARDMLALLARHSALRPQPAPAAYQVPEGPGFADYLLRLEQLLAVRCHGAGDPREPGLNGEREILDGNLRQCLAHPHSVNARLLLARTLRAMEKARPQAAAEFRERVLLLQREHPLPGAAQAAVDQALQAAG